MDRQTAIDRITETENLTDGLEDDDANWLLDWGIAHVDGLVTGIEDEDAAGDKLNQLMAVMRTLNQIAADRAAKPADALATDIRTFLERYQEAFGAPQAAASTATPSPATDAQAAPTASQVPSTSSMSSVNLPTSTPTKQGEAAPTSSTSLTPSSIPATTAPSSATPPANATTNATTNATAQASQAPDQVAQAANKIAGMTPKEAMQYLLSLAEAGAPAA